MTFHNRKKRILFAMLIVLIAIQFIRPARNQGGQVLQTDISNSLIIPENVYSILKNSCYDCHSNNTNYPWYFNIQPIGWIMADDIKKGKAKINFSEWNSLSVRKQKTKLQEIENIIKEGKMPLKSYKLLHEKARLSESDKKLLFQWIENAKDSLTNSN